MSLDARVVSPATPRTRPLRVAIVAPFGDLGGAELYLLRILDATDRIEPHVLLLGDGLLRGALESRGVPVALSPTGRRGIDVARAGLAISPWLDRIDPDVVLSNGVKAAAAAAPVCWGRGVRHVWIKHDHSFDGPLTGVLSRLVDEVVVGCDELLDAVPRRDADVVTPPMPDQAPWPVDAARARISELVGPWSGRTLGMLSRLTPYKGIDVAIRALAACRGTGADAWRLVVFGPVDSASPDEAARLLDVARECGVENRVHLVGFEPDAARLLPAFDAVAMLTRPRGRRTPVREGFGMASAEAMIAGVPVLAAADGSETARRIAAGVGLVVDAADPGSVADALGRLSPDVAATMGARARRMAGEQFVGGAVAAERLLSTLTRAAQRPGAGLETRREPVSVVIPALDEARVIDEVLTPVIAQLGAFDEVLVVDSGSMDATRAKVRRRAAADPRVRLIEVERCSIADSRNAGVAAARHDLIACTDAGCRVDDGWLDSIRAAFAEDERAEVLVGVYRAEVRTSFQAAMAGVAFPDPAELRRAGVVRRAWLRTVGPRYDARRGDGRSLAFTRQAFEVAGGFRSDLLTAEDEAFVRDAVSGGARAVLLPEAAVTWAQRDTARLAFRQFRGYGRGAVAGGSPAQAKVDLVRAGGYVVMGLLPLFGGRRGAAISAGLAAGLLAMPLARVLERGATPGAVALLPAAQLTKDLGKLTGVLDALLLGRTTALRRPS